MMRISFHHVSTLHPVNDHGRWRFIVLFVRLAVHSSFFSVPPSPEECTIPYYIIYMRSVRLNISNLYLEVLRKP